MKHLKLFETYRDLDSSKYKNKYDKDFANYALNERPLYWSDEDMTACRDIYGNKDVGIVYHGNRINDEALLERLEEIKSKLGKEETTLPMRLKSTSPHKDEAESFALYVKSYDEMTTFRMVAQAVENGSAGTYGGYLLTLKPTPEQVILANFGGGRYPTSSAETEALVSGEIQVLDVEIFYPLKRDTYLDQFANLNLNGLFNDLYVRWFSKHKLPRPDSSYIISLLHKLTTEKEAIDFVKRLARGRFVFSTVTKDEFLAIPVLKNLLKYVSSYKDGGLAFHFSEKDVIGVETIKGMSDYLSKMPKYKKQLDTTISEILTRPYNIISEIKTDKSGEHVYAMYFQLDSNAHLVLSALQKYMESGRKVKHPIINDINTAIRNVFDKVIVGKHIKDTSYNTLSALSSYLNSMQYETKYLKGVVDTNYIQDCMRYFYGQFAHRYNGGKDSDSMLRIYGECLKHALVIMSSL